MARVLLTGFCAVPGPRRAGVQLRHVIRAVMQQHSVDLLVAREGDQSYVDRQGNVRILRVPVAETATSTPNDLTVQIQSFQRALKRQLDGAEYEIVHCRDSWSGAVVLEAKRRLGYSMIYDLTRAPFGESAPDPELDARYSRHEQTCLRGADVVLAPTHAAVLALADRTPARVVLSPSGVDIDRFDWDDPPTSGVPHILYAGSLDASRGVRVLIRAMVAIAHDVNAKLVLAGPVISPRFERALRDHIGELGLSDKVELMGSIDHEQVPALIATATVCVVPAASDLIPNPTVAFPSKLLEYMACRRAIVAPKRDTVALVVEDQREALLFEPGDPKDLARNVVRLLTEPALREQIANAAYERVRREFTASATRRTIRAVYAEIAAQLIRVQPAAAEMPKGEMMTEDDFEATVIEQAAEVAAGDTGLHRMADLEVLDDVLDNLDSGELPIPAPLPGAAAMGDARRWTESAVTSVAMADESVVTVVAAVSWPRDSNDDDGTPADGVRAPNGLSTRDSAFVAGEIDVPTPTPLIRPSDNAEASDPDTGVSIPARSRTTR